MKSAHHVDLALLLNLSIGAGVVLPGMAATKNPVVAQAQRSNELEAAIAEGKRLFNEGSKVSLTAAIQQFERALVLSRAEGQRVQRGWVLIALGRIYSDLGEKTQALEYYNQALSISRAVGNRSGEATTLGNLAHLYSTQNKLTDALENINASIQIIESLRKELKDDNLKTSYFASVQGYYQFKTAILMQLHQQQPSKGYDAQALETGDQSRARLLRELLIQANANIKKDVLPELRQPEQTLNQTIDAKETQLIQFSSQPDKAAQLSTLNQEIAALYTQSDDLKNTIRATNPAYANLQYPKPITLKEIQQQLDRDTLMLQYRLGEQESYLWVIGQTSLKTYILPKRSDIENTAYTFRKELQLPAPKSATQLTQQILAPAVAELGNKRLVIIPDGILHTIPFATTNPPSPVLFCRVLMRRGTIVKPISASLTSVLHQPLAIEKSHAASLRDAQLQMWQQGKAPYYWAAFTLQGEWRN